MTTMARHRFEAAELLILNGKVQDGRAPQLAVNLPGVLRGEGIFETFLVIDGRPSCLLPRHEARLRHSAALMGMELGELGLMAEIDVLLAQLPTEGRWRVRYTVLRGLDHQLVRFFTAGPVQPPAEEVDLLWSRFRQDPGNPLCGAKTTSRAMYQVAHAEALASDCFDALLPTIDGDVSECTAANLLCWADGALRTPSLDRGILAGVTRSVLLEACAQAEIPVFEQEIPQKLLCEADEVFVSNAVIGVIPVAKIKGLHEGYPGRRGPMLPRLRAAFQAALPELETPPARQEHS